MNDLNIQLSEKDVLLMLGEKEVVIFKLRQTLAEMAELNSKAAAHLAELLAENKKLKEPVTEEKS